MIYPSLESFYMWVYLWVWVSDCCLTPTQSFFSAISWREQVNFQWDDDDEDHFVLYRSTLLQPLRWKIVFTGSDQIL